MRMSSRKKKSTAIKRLFLQTMLDAALVACGFLYLFAIVISVNKDVPFVTFVLIAVPVVLVFALIGYEKLRSLK